MRVSVLTGNKRQQKKAFLCRTWVNDVEVTHDCQEADDREGWVLLLKRDESGHAYLNAHREVAKERRHGRVRIERRH